MTSSTARYLFPLILALSLGPLSCGSTAGQTGSPAHTPGEPDLDVLPTEDLIGLIKTGRGKNEEFVLRTKMRAISKLGKRKQDAAQGVQCLVELIQDETTDPRLYVVAVDVLGKMGPDAQAAVPALIDQLPKAVNKIVRSNDSDDEYAAAVDSALGSITGEHFGWDEARWRSWLKQRAGQQ